MTMTRKDLLPGEQVMKLTCIRGKIRRGSVGVVVMMLALAATGCASSQKAGMLAEAGQNLTVVAEGNFSALRDGLDHYIAALYVEAGLTGKPLPSDSQMKSIRSVQVGCRLPRTPLWLRLAVQRM
jgi:hypothetical protein